MLPPRPLPHRPTAADFSRGVGSANSRSATVLLRGARGLCLQHHGGNQLAWVGSANSEFAPVLLRGRMGCAFITMGAIN